MSWSKLRVRHKFDQAVRLFKGFQAHSSQRKIRKAGYLALFMFGVCGSESKDSSYCYSRMFLMQLLALEIALVEFELLFKVFYLCDEIRVVEIRILKDCLTLLLGLESEFGIGLAWKTDVSLACICVGSLQIDPVMI